MFYFVKTPWWVKRIFPDFIWEMERKEKKIYLTFDDGPHPVHTPAVLDILFQFNAKATFFCIGKNVELYPEVYNRIIAEGHSVGNHTFNHLNGKKTKTAIYIDDIKRAAQLIETRLFRPPYGRIRPFQSKLLTEMNKSFKIIMWTVISGDFDHNVSKERCLENVLFNTGPGSILLFHDSEKASEKMLYVLPIALKTFAGKGYSFEKIAL